MIYCPKCGTANRDGSRFCNECGQRLGAHTRVRCPQCGAFNSIKNVFCDDCGGRLLPAHGEAAASDTAAPIKGLSLPTKGPVSSDVDDPVHDEPDEDEDVPGWLRELGSSWSSQGPVEPATGDGDEIPDWLKDLRESLPDDQEVDPVSDEADETPDWLAELRGSAAGNEPARPASETPDVPEGDVPDGLAGTRAGAVEEPEEQETARTDDEGDLPDWLKELRGPAAAREPDRPVAAEPDVPEADVPDWLAGIRSGSVEEPEEEDAARADDEGDVPDWLAELRGPAAAREPARLALETPDVPEADVPDWLAGMRAGAVEEPEEQEAARTDDEESLPDWLAELRAPQEKEYAAPPEPEVPPERPAPRAPRVEEAELPAWLAALRPAPEDEAPPPPSLRGARRREEADEGQIPDWLPSRRSSERDEPELAGLEFEAEASASESPDWLAELRMQRRQAESELEEEEFEYSTGDIPDWLVPSEGGFEEETLARADIPEWLLALKPAALRAEGEPQGASALIEEPVEETGILAGLHGTLPVEMLIAQPRAVKPSAAVEMPVTDTPNARLFAEIVGRPIQSAPKELAQPRRQLLALLPRWLLYIALIGVVALPLLVGQPLVPRDLEAPPPVQSLYDRVGDLDENSLVLVAFDYDPTSSGEMDLLARALVGSVMERGARVIAVSTLPAGPATAQRVLDDLAGERPPYAGRYGERYANLGYLPGQAAGVRLLSQSLPLALVHDFGATPLSEMPVLDNMVSAADLDLVLELAATQESLRWWIEQAGAPYGVSIAAGTSAAVEPFARAYYQADPPQLVGLVSGVPGAVSYEMVATGESVPDDRLAARLDAQLGGHLIFIAVLLVGWVMGLLRRDTGKEA